MVLGSYHSIIACLQRLRLAVTSLENVATQWNVSNLISDTVIFLANCFGTVLLTFAASEQVLPKERRKEQENIDTLVEHVESTVISLQEV